MTTKQELEALADRVEALTGPDREVDDAIYIAATGACLHVPHVTMVEVEPGEREPMTVCRYCGSSRIGVPCHPYTASLDVAMKLVPDGWFTFMASEDRHSHSWKWHLRGGYGWNAECRAQKPPLALTAAALRARAQEMNDEAD